MLIVVSVTNRVANVTEEINGITIPEGTIIFIPIYAINFDETMWGPSVDTFDPDRWDNLPETVTNYSYLTFLQGPRSCIGRRFAETEMKVLLVALIQKLRFDEVVKGRHVEKKAMITTRPKNGMYLKISTVEY
jgi:cytochrome P450